MVTVWARESIENHLFKIAKEHAQLASQYVDRDDVPRMQIEMKHSIIAIVMSFTALEALSNDIYSRLTRKDFDTKEFKTFDRNTEGLVGKWKELVKLAFQSKHPNGKEPSIPNNFTNSLDELRKLRHQIIHYVPKPENTKFLRRTARNHFVSPELEIFTAEEATKAIETVRTLLRTFHEITGYEVPKLE